MSIYEQHSLFNGLMEIKNRNGSSSDKKSDKKNGLPIKKFMLLACFIIVGFVLVTGCTTLTIRGTKTTASPSPTITPSVQATTPEGTVSPVPVLTQNTSEIKKGILNVSIGEYIGVLPVFLDNKIAGNVSMILPISCTIPSCDLNLT